MHTTDPSSRPDFAALDDQLISTLRPVFEQLLKRESISAEPQLLDNFARVYLPLACWIAQQHQSTPLVIGINGSQGSGKSTLSRILGALLEQGFNKNVVTLSIDDFYKTREQRQIMAQALHPLFVTRGVPGTHDIELAIAVLAQLTQQQTFVRLPAFDKASDDRKAESDWLITGQIADVILFEGWCVSARPENEAALLACINELESNEDEDASWRRYVNQQLATDYQRLFAFIDKLIMLKISGFDKVLEWRGLQENKLINQLTHNRAKQAMSEQELRRFILHFERITRHTLNEMPERADVILDINDDHQVYEVFYRKNP